MDVLLRRYALDSSRDILDTDEPLSDIVAVCKRQIRLCHFSMLVKPARRGRRDLVAVIMDSRQPALRTFSWTASTLQQRMRAAHITLALTAAVDGGHMGPIVEIGARLGMIETLVTTRLMLRAACVGNLSLVKDLHTAVATYRERPLPDRETSVAAAVGPHCACGNSAWASNVGLTAWEHKHAHILDWLLEAKCPYALRPDLHRLNAAVAMGNISLARWAASHLGRPVRCTRASLDHAAGIGAVDVVRWAHETNVRRCAPSTLQAAAASKSRRALDVLEWACGDNDRPAAVPEWRDAQIALQAAMNGSLNVIHWLAKTHLDCLTPEAARYAARRGHASIVLFLDKIKVAPLARFNPLKRVAKSLNAKALDDVASAGAAYDDGALKTAIRHKSVPMVEVLCKHYADRIDRVEAMRMAGQEVAFKIARIMAATLPGACLTHARAAVPSTRSAKTLGTCPCAACHNLSASALRSRQQQRRQSAQSKTQPRRPKATVGGLVERDKTED
jgi:hypothetical protein